MIRLSVKQVRNQANRRFVFLGNNKRSSFHTMNTDSQKEDVQVQWNLFTDKKHTEEYAKFRPTYPAELINAVFERVNTKGVEKRLIVDIGCGSGQATVQLAKYCKENGLTSFKLIGLDPSANQIQNAFETTPDEFKSLVEYKVSSAENTSLESNSVDLITVAQALHWFDLDVFFKEVDRLLKPNGVFATIVYDLNQFDNQEAQDELMKLYNGKLGSYWSPKRKMVDEQYSNVQFPYGQTLKKHVIPYRKRMTLNDYINYLGTWSSIQKYRSENQNDQTDILEEFKVNLMPKLGITSDDQQIEFVWPMILLSVVKQ